MTDVCDEYKTSRLFCTIHGEFARTWDESCPICKLAAPAAAPRTVTDSGGTMSAFGHGPAAPEPTCIGILNGCHCSACMGLDPDPAPAPAYADLCARLRSHRMEWCNHPPEWSVDLTENAATAIEALQRELRIHDDANDVLARWLAAAEAERDAALARAESAEKAGREQGIREAAEIAHDAHAPKYGSLCYQIRLDILALLAPKEDDRG